MIGIIGAMADEVNGLKAIMETVKVEKISSVEFFSGKICGIDAVVAEAGIGKVNAAITAQTMIMRYNTERIINIGVAGGLAPSLDIGDIVIADKVCEHDMDTTACGDEAGYISGLNRVYMDCDTETVNMLERAAESLGIHHITGTIASGDLFVSSDEQRTRIINTFSAAAAEMEGGAIGHVCTVNNVPFCVLRAISDSANSDSVVDFPAFAKKAAENSINIIKIFFEFEKGVNSNE